MNPERTAFLCEESKIEIVPKIDEPTLRLISGDIGPLEAGIPVMVPLWMAVQLRRKNHCTVVMPSWMSTDQLKRFVADESDSDTLVALPKYFFEITRILVKDAKEDILEADQIKHLIHDLWDKREAKIRSSALKFISQSEASYARMDNVQDAEVSSASLRATLSASAKIAQFVDLTHELTM